MRVAIIYHMFPHYRVPVMRALDACERLEVTFFGRNAAFDGVLPADPSTVRRFVNVPFHFVGGKFWQSAALSIAMSRRFDAIVFLGNPNFLSTWLAAPIARLTGKRVLFWSHGWLKAETGLRRWLRRLFYRLSDGALVYNDRARELGAAAGYPAERIVPIYNSLDTDAADRVVAAIEAAPEPPHDARAQFTHPERPLLICSARLTQLCRFDMLIDAAAMLKAAGRPANVMLVGDGPECDTLAEQAERLGVDLVLPGACYDEAVLGRWIYQADLTVSPGKIGLTAMHSLMYGTPAITHGDLDHQMPEVEAIVPGETGAFFERRDSADLARAIREWLDCAKDRASIRRACRQLIADRWNPQNQARIIERTLLDMAR